MPEPPGSQRIRETARARGHEVEFLYEPLFNFCFGLDEPILYDGKPFCGYDVILARPTIVDEPSLHTVTADILKAAGYQVVNAMPTFSVSKNKLAQLMRLNEVNIPQPKSIIVRHPKNTEEAAKELDYPVIIKLAFGTGGKGVFLAKDFETLQPLVDYLILKDRNPIIIQEFIAEAKCRDLRAFVVGEEVVAAMERVASQNEFRANAHRGGTGQEVELTDEEQELALAAANAFNLEIAGVDLIRSKRGPLVIEVNSNPGFEELEKATGIDVASKIVGYLESV